MASIEKEFDRFLRDVEIRSRGIVFNKWIESRDIKIYLRKSRRYLLDNFTKVGVFLDIATIDAAKPGNGVFTRFLNYAESMRLFDGIFIENILDNERFVDFFVKRGYKEVPQSSTDRMVVTMVKIWSE